MTVLSPSSLAVFLSLSARRASSRPSQLWLSNMRCFAQKRFWQKPQSPTIGCAAARQASLEQRGLLDFRLVGVAALDVEGVEVEVDGLTVAGCWEDASSREGAVCSTGVLLLGGEESCSVDDSSSLSSPTVLEGSSG